MRSLFSVQRVVQARLEVVFMGKQGRQIFADVCAPMRIGLFASNAALAEYFVTALGLADHAVTLYPAVQDLFSGLAAAASRRGGAPHEVLLLELILDERGRQILARLSDLAKDLGLPIVVLTTAGRDAIDLAQAAFPALCLRQLPLPLRALLALIQAQHQSVSPAALSSSE